jgi:hypothetical protein
VGGIPISIAMETQPGTAFSQSLHLPKRLPCGILKGERKGGIFMHENKFSISLKKAAAASLCLGLLWGLPLETVQARVKEQRAEAVSYTMEYPEVKVPNSRAEKAINEDILRYVSDFQKAYQAGKFYQGDFSYKVRYEDDNVVSLTLADYRYHIGAAHGFTRTQGLTYRKTDGKKLPLSHFVKLAPDDKFIVLSQPILDSRKQRVPWQKTFLTDSIGWTHAEVTDNYCLEKGGRVELIYQPYDLGCYALGTLYVDLSPQVVDYLNRKNQQEQG